MKLYFFLVTYRTLGGVRTKGRPAVYRTPPIAARTEWQAMQEAVAKCERRFATQEIISVALYHTDTQIITK